MISARAAIRASMVPALGLVMVMAAGGLAPAFAYIGPGPGLTVLGALWAVIAAVLLAVLAIFRWPVRYLIRKLRGRHPGAAAGHEEEHKDDTPDRQ